MEANDISLKVGLELQKLKSDLREAQGMLKTTFSDFTAKEITKLNAKIASTQKTLKNTLSGSALGLPKDIGKGFKDASMYLDEFKPNLRKTATGTDLVNKTIKDLDMRLTKTKRSFAGWALSIMFFGMALKRTFDTIWKGSTKVFQDISHSVEGTVTDFDLLNGSLDYLKFISGQALEPLAAAMIPIIDFVTDIIQNNEKWFAGTVAALGVGGTVLTAIGMGTLALNGLLEAYSLATGKNITTSTLGKSLSSFGWDRILSIGFAVASAKDVMDAIAAEDYFGAAIDALKTVGFLAYAGGNKKAAGVMLAVGVAFDFVDALMDGKGLTVQSFANLLNKNAPALFMVNPAVGAAALTVGVVLNLLTDNAKLKFIQFLTNVAGGIMVAIASVVETIIAPFILTVNSAIKAINLLKPGKDIELIGQYTATKSLSNHLRDLNNLMGYDTGNYYGMKNEPFDTSSMYTEQYTKRDIPIIKVYLETDAMSEIFSENIVRKIEVE